MDLIFLMRVYSRDPAFLIIALPVVIILALIFEKNPKIESEEDKK